MTAPPVTMNLFKHKGPIAHAARQFGFNVDARFTTIDGDHARVFVIDGGHPFPLVGEIYDVDNERTWLARWNTLGHYSGTQPAQARHSLRRNIEPRERRPRPASLGRSWTDTWPRLSHPLPLLKFRAYSPVEPLAAKPPQPEAAAQRPQAASESPAVERAATRPLTPLEFKAQVDRLAKEAGIDVLLLVAGQQ